VIVGCFMNPISIDMFGLVKLSSRLARVEERLQILVSEYNAASVKKRKAISILNPKQQDTKSHILDSQDVAFWTRCAYQLFRPEV
jgi:hypothetical protein